MLKITDDRVSEWKVNDPDIDPFYVALDRFGDTRRIPMYDSYNSFMLLWDSRSFGYYEINPNLRMWSYSTSDDVFEVNVPATAIIRALAPKSAKTYQVIYGAVIFTGDHVHDATRLVPPAPNGVLYDDVARISVFGKLARDEFLKN